MPAELAGQALASTGKLDFSGSAESFHTEGDLRLGPPQHMADIRLRARGAPERIRLEQFDIRQRGGELSAVGLIDLEPRVGWHIEAKARNFDPGEFAAAWPGDLSFGIASRGKLEEAGPQGTLQMTRLNGELRHRPIVGSADLALLPGNVLAGRLDVRSGRSTVNIEGERGAELDARLRVDVPSLDDWVPGAGGALQGEIDARGTWPDVQVQGTLSGDQLQFAANTARSVRLEFSVAKPTDPNGTAHLVVADAVAAGFQFASLDARASGGLQDHRLEFRSTGDPLSADFVVRGAQGEEGWAGSLEQSLIAVKDAARLQLQRPVAIRYAAEGASVADACFADGEIRLCAAGSTQANGAFDVRYDIRSVPLALANVFAPPSLPVSFAGKLDGSGTLKRDGDGIMSGAARINSSSGHIARQFEATSDQPEILLSYADFAVQAELQGNDARVRVDSRLNDTGSLRGQLALTERDATTQLRGEVSARLPSIGVIQLFAPQLANVHGRAALDARVAGTLVQPALTGELTLTELATDVPAVGLKLHDGRVRVAARSERDFTLEGAIRSGEGTLSFDGTANLDGVAQVQARGKNFLAADIPSARALIDPDLRFTRDSERMNLEGRVHVPEATVNLQKLPRNQRTQNASPDVVVIDAKTQEEAQVESIPLTAAITVSLGEKVELTGFGLQAKVAGQLLVRESPGSPTTGAGEVRVLGTYKAYGQDLTIRQGQLLFAGTPLDNPGLNFVAVREVEDVTAGLRVTGTAQAPVLNVFSEPAMSQSNALAYLVAGKPLDQVGSGEGEGDAVQSAARSLGTAAGGLLAKNIGKRLGVDTVAVGESEGVDGAALTVGQYLSPRLYLSYGVGLFEPGEVITLRYKLTDELALEALNGSRDSRAGIEYRTER